jgi:hypothetical protein
MAGQVVQPVFPAGGNDQVVVVGGEHPGEFVADPGGGSGDQYR